MNRRKFFASIAAVGMVAFANSTNLGRVALATADPLPDPSSNTLLSPDMIAREALIVLENNLKLSEWQKRGFPKARLGDTIRIRRPVKLRLNH